MKRETVNLRDLDSMPKYWGGYTTKWRRDTSATLFDPSLRVPDKDRGGAWMKLEPLSDEELFKLAHEKPDEEVHFLVDDGHSTTVVKAKSVAIWPEERE